MFAQHKSDRNILNTAIAFFERIFIGAIAYLLQFWNMEHSLGYFIKLKQ
ncbi:MAG: hypothetical protein KME54_05300 [Tolypothrix brevis GSE-NOS-MK-07-07A]|nr:hypothetical protein [Tolypothrix brevis GSE-NOS-MK-07-07A]